VRAIPPRSSLRAGSWPEIAPEARLGSIHGIESALSQRFRRTIRVACLFVCRYARWVDKFTKVAFAPLGVRCRSIVHISSGYTTDPLEWFRRIVSTITPPSNPPRIRRQQPQCRASADGPACSQVRHPVKTDVKNKCRRQTPPAWRCTLVAREVDVGSDSDNSH
jgi:hypothetical protein